MLAGWLPLLPPLLLPPLFRRRRCPYLNFSAGHPDPRWVYCGI
jgi:hypothetical protein